MATCTFQKGDKVCTHSLNSTAYNSLEGTVLDGPQVGGKYQVRLSLSNGATQDFHLKQSNLELVARSAAPAAAEESGPRGITKWAEEEIKRVAANPPPPWVTEGLAPEFAADGPWPTQVVLGGPPGSQEHSVKNMLDNCFTGAYSDVSIVCHEGYLEFDDGAGSEPENHSGMTPLMMVGLTADIPAMRAVLWSGADVNFQGGPDRRTALWLLCGSLLKEGDSCGTAPPLRSRFRAVEFLLSVGADPGLADARGATPLALAAQASDLQLAKALLEGPLGHRAAGGSAAKRAAAGAPSGKVRKALLQLAKVARERGESDRPAVKCACGSGKRCEECHDQPNGAPLPLARPCPCTRNKERRARAFSKNEESSFSPKSYGSCCFKRGHYLRETLDETKEPPAFMYGPGVGLVGQYLSEVGEKHKAAGLSEEEAASQPLFPAEIGGVKTSDMFTQFSKRIGLQLLERGEVDPAWAWAMGECDFSYPRPWAQAQRSLSKGEMELRASEWNALVDRYVTERPRMPGAGGRDHRPLLEVERACKVGWTGGPLFFACGCPGCPKLEEAPKAFKNCGRCKVARYCSPACQKRAWGVCHKADCGPSAPEPRLANEIATSAAMEAFSASAPTTLPKP